MLQLDQGARAELPAGFPVAFIIHAARRTGMGLGVLESGFTAFEHPQLPSSLALGRSQGVGKHEAFTKLKILGMKGALKGC